MPQTRDFQIRLRHRHVSESMLVQDMMRVASEVGSPTLTIPQYDERVSFGWRTVISRMGTWNRALQLAGLEVRNRRHIPDDELFENLATVWMKLGRQPYCKDMSDRAAGAEFSTTVYIKRFQSWNNALLAFSDFINNPETHPEGEELFEVNNISSRLPTSGAQSVTLTGDCAPKS